MQRCTSATPRQQTRETLRNIEALLECGQPRAPRRARRLHDAPVCVTRRTCAARTITPSSTHELRSAAGEGAQALYLHADLCREDLLVEIEADRVRHLPSGRS
jgi:chorismate lyase/3-hydroxybenzoate synthase